MDKISVTGISRVFSDARQKRKELKKMFIKNKQQQLLAMNSMNPALDNTNNNLGSSQSLDVDKHIRRTKQIEKDIRLRIACLVPGPMSLVATEQHEELLKNIDIMKILALLWQVMEPYRDIAAVMASNASAPVDAIAAATGTRDVLSKEGYLKFMTLCNHAVTESPEPELALAEWEFDSRSAEGRGGITETAFNVIVLVSQSVSSQSVSCPSHCLLLRQLLLCLLPLHATNTGYFCLLSTAIVVCICIYVCICFWRVSEVTHDVLRDNRNCWRR
jgi:hypothetical protein